MSFNDPSSGGDFLPLDDLNGALLLFDVHEQLGEINTSFGPATPIRADAYVLDGPLKASEYIDALVFPRKLQMQLRGSIGSKVIGRLGRGAPKPGQSPPWELSVATAADKTLGQRFLDYQSAQRAPVLADPEEPF